jgi:hypothetical protein
MFSVWRLKLAKPFQSTKINFTKAIAHLQCLSDGLLLVVKLTGRLARQRRLRSELLEVRRQYLRIKMNSYQNAEMNVNTVRELRGAAGPVANHSSTAFSTLTPCSESAKLW